MAMERLDKIKEVLRKEGLLGWQVFDCESTVGDVRETVYGEDGIRVKVSYYYEYVEVLGLSKNEFHSLTETRNGFLELKKKL